MKTSIKLTKDSSGNRILVDCQPLKKGICMKEFRISPAEFDRILKYVIKQDKIVMVNDADLFCKIQHGLGCQFDKSFGYLYIDNSRTNYAKLIVYKQLISSLKTVASVLVRSPDVSDGVNGTVPAWRVRLWGKAEIEENYTKEEVEAIIKTCNTNEIKPFAFRITNNKIQKWTNCVYQDIHKAHNSELIRLFPKCKAFVKMYEDAKKYKAKGKLVEAKRCKDYPNLLVGCFNQKNKETGEKVEWLYGLDASPIYWDIVNRIYTKISKQYKLLSTDKSKLVYAQTDGLIVSNPNWDNVKDSDDLGDFGIEPIDNKTVWTYSRLTTDEETGYTIYQYFENGKKIVKGSLPDKFKEQVDLSKGIVVRYKRTRKEITKGKYLVEDILLETMEA